MLEPRGMNDDTQSMMFAIESHALLTELFRRELRKIFHMPVGVERSIFSWS